MVFGSKSKDSADASSDAAPKLKKGKSFKRIRGLLKGESRKERRARKEAKAAARAAAAAGATNGSNATNPHDNQNDELSTVFGVDVDDASFAIHAPSNSTAASFLSKGGNSTQATSPATTSSSTIPTPSAAYILKVVLLLMDPETRRFELLQLEFDSLKALVSDVLAQIPLSVTEEALRVQLYTGIAGREGTEMPPAKLLATFCQGNEVLVAIPEGVPPQECARLARPILSDEKVVTMLASSGIDASGWKEDPKKKKKKSAMKSRSAPETPQRGSSSSAEQSKKKSSKTFTVILVVLVALLLQVFHVYISAPIHPGNIITPGIWLSKCGILTVLPSCENAYLHFSRDGVLTHYNAAKQVTWQMEGTPCDVEDDECINGLQLTDEGKVLIGSNPVSYVTSFVKEAKMTPWPFAETPKLKVWRK